MKSRGEIAKREGQAHCDIPICSALSSWHISLDQFNIASEESGSFREFEYLLTHDGQSSGIREFRGALDIFSFQVVSTVGIQMSIFPWRSSL